MKNLWLLALSLFFILSCKTSKESFIGKNESLLGEIEVVGKKHPYRPSAERKNDLIHTALDVRFDWEKQYLYGTAKLTLTPYFYATDNVVLDAKGMTIEKVELVGGTTLDYMYDGQKLNINLDKVYKRGEEYHLLIEYVSKPNELEKTEGLSAISDDKGLYFINPLGEDKEKPMQIWTQGEPESNSVWFPTIDKPNERCTQEISMTVANKFLAMSNGVLVGDVDNGDGTHTVSWKQDKPHAPYLFMMTIGEFARINDEWNGMSVDYFVEKEYENVAREIFGETPAMLTFFSDKLGVTYQWDKYWQVCVRDYVSGAMENTSAVIFGEFVQRDERELLDEDHEDIVSHELFHHWFGDLVTCESWANLPLNESFATYGEVLWREHRYGEDEMYRKVYADMGSYFAEASRGKQVDMIRYHHDNAEDMFDSHSYAKGGVILNMLRNVVGDDAFFTSLKTYLEDNKYQSVEIHNLRLAFEKVTGQDLNWFFNQWFLSAGHPIITIDREITDTSVVIKMTQAASAETKLVYNLPLEIAIHSDNGTAIYDIIFHQKEQLFEFPFEDEVYWVSVDVNNSLLAQIENNQSEESWIYQFNHAANMLDKLYALEHFSSIEEPSEAVVAIYRKALQDDYWFIQDFAAGSYPIEAEDAAGIKLLKDLATNATKSDVKASAILTLSILEDASFEPIYKTGLENPSYRVNAASLDAIMYTNPDVALSQAEKWEDLKNYEIIDVVGYVYSEVGEADKVTYFENTTGKNEDEYTRLYANYYYSMFLSRMDPKIALNGIDFFENWGKTDESSYAYNAAQSSIKRVKLAFEGEAEALKLEMTAPGINKSQKMALESEMINYLHVSERADAALKGFQEKK